MNDHSVRSARPDDALAIRDLAERAWQAAYADLLSQSTIETAMHEWYDPATTRQAIARDDVVYLVADADDHLVGYLSGGPLDDRPVELDAIYVDPDRWGAGIGTALLSQFETTCARRGADAIELQVLRENDVGRSFYASRGYELVTERVTDLFGEAVDVCVYRGDVA